MDLTCPSEPYCSHERAPGQNHRPSIKDSPHERLRPWGSPKLQQWIISNLSPVGGHSHRAPYHVGLWILVFLAILVALFAIFLKRQRNCQSKSMFRFQIYFCTYFMEQNKKIKEENSMLECTRYNCNQYLVYFLIEDAYLIKICNTCNVFS